MSERYCWGALALLCLSAACSTARTRVAPPPLAATPALRDVRNLAPDFAARVREAQLSLAAEPSTDGDAEQLRRVQLLTTAARAEAERITLVRKADSYEQRIAKASELRARLEREATELVRERALTRAAVQARAEALWVLAALARGAPLSAAERDRVWEFCTRRAQGLLAAASALGASGEPITRAELQLTAAGTAKLPERVPKARQALASAYAALGVARTQRASPGAAEQHDLLMRAGELGLSAQLADDGVFIESDPPGSARSRESDARLTLLAELLVAFPHGAVNVLARNPQGAFLPALQARLGARLHVEPRREIAGDVVRVQLPAYGARATVPVAQ